MKLTGFPETQRQWIKVRVSTAKKKTQMPTLDHSLVSAIGIVDAAPQLPWGTQSVRHWVWYVGHKILLLGALLLLLLQSLPALSSGKVVSECDLLLYVAHFPGGTWLTRLALASAVAWNTSFLASTVGRCKSQWEKSPNVLWECKRYRVVTIMTNIPCTAWPGDRLILYHQKVFVWH